MCCDHCCCCYYCLSICAISVMRLPSKEALYQEFTSLCLCGEIHTMSHMLTLILWRSKIAACLDYSLLIMKLLLSWPVRTFTSAKLLCAVCCQVWFDNTGYVSMVAYMNVVNNMLLRASLSHDNVDPKTAGITLVNHPLNRTHIQMARYLLYASLLLHFLDLYFNCVK